MYTVESIQTSLAGCWQALSRIGAINFLLKSGHQLQVKGTLFQELPPSSIQFSPAAERILI